MKSFWNAWLPENYHQISRFRTALSIDECKQILDKFIVKKGSFPIWDATKLKGEITGHHFWIRRNLSRDDSMTFDGVLDSVGELTILAGYFYIPRSGDMFVPYALLILGLVGIGMVGSDIFRWLFQGVLPGLIVPGIVLTLFALIFIRIRQVGIRQLDKQNKELLIGFLKAKLEVEQIE